jgi:Na+/H+-translocating membrane pyrophosphatase
MVVVRTCEMGATLTSFNMGFEMTNGTGAWQNMKLLLM